MANLKAQSEYFKKRVVPAARKMAGQFAYDCSIQEKKVSLSMSELNARQKLFVKEYLIDLNASAAYKRAGYSVTGAAADTNASKLLRVPKVAKFIQELMDKRAEKLEISADYVLNVIKSTIERCIQAEPVKAADGTVSGEYKFDAAAVLKGAELLGKHLKLFTDKTEISGGLKISRAEDLTDDELAAIANSTNSRK